MSSDEPPQGGAFHYVETQRGADDRTGILARLAQFARGAWRPLIGWAGAAFAFGLAFRATLGLPLPDLQTSVVPLAMAVLPYIVRSVEKHNQVAG